MALDVPYFSFIFVHRAHQQLASLIRALQVSGRVPVQERSLFQHVSLGGEYLTKAGNRVFVRPHCTPYVRLSCVM